MPVLIEAYRLWWDNANTHPLFAIYNEGKEFERARHLRDWMDPNLYAGAALAQGMEITVQTGDFAYLDDAIGLVDGHLRTLTYAGEAFPHVELNFGPGVVAAFITGFSKYGDGTVWFEPPELLSWDEILSLDPDIESPYASVAMAGVQRIAEYFQGKAVVSQTDLGGVFDILASLRSTGQLLMDFHDRAMTVSQGALVIEKIWQ